MAEAEIVARALEFPPEVTGTRLALATVCEPTNKLTEPVGVGKTMNGADGATKGVSVSTWPLSTVPLELLTVEAVDGAVNDVVALAAATVQSPLSLFPNW